MIVFPKSKINLGLRITGKRPDGYHNIETIFYPVGLYDALEFVACSEDKAGDHLTVTGIPVGTGPEENIVMIALSRLRRQYSFPWLKIHLHKAIPTGAGLGGGSSDAACLLKALIRFFTIPVEEQQLRDMALEIGSDCPFFLAGDPAFATGRGEILEAIKPVLAGYYLVILNPGVGINTGEAYGFCRPVKPETSLREVVTRQVSEWKDLLLNDFEDFAFKKHPVIGRIKADLYSHGVLFSSMSGSGSSVYGIFSDKPDDFPTELKKMIIWEGYM